MDIAAVVAGAKKAMGSVKDAAGATIAKAGEVYAAPFGSDTPTIFARLEADHNEIRELLKTLCATTTRAGKRRAQLFDRLKRLVTAHARAEEAVLYDVLKIKRPTRAETLEGYVEHHMADILLLEMSRTPPTDDQWTAKLSVLRENLEHHLGEEERGLFRDGRKALSESQAETLGTAFVTAKARRLATSKSPVKRSLRGKPAGSRTR
jgi:hypothetical protein